MKLQERVSRSVANRKRNLARKLMRPFLKYFYDTHFVMGSPERLKIGERSALANTLFNVSSGNITVGDRSIFGQGVMVITGRHEFRNGMRISLDPKEDDGFWGVIQKSPRKVLIFQSEKAFSWHQGQLFLGNAILVIIVLLQRAQLLQRAFQITR